MCILKRWAMMLTGIFQTARKLQFDEAAVKLMREKVVDLLTLSLV